MPIRLPQGSFGVSDLICRRLTFIGDNSEMISADSLTPTRIVLPQVDEPLTPTLAFGIAANDGIYSSAAGTLNFATIGVLRFRIAGGTFRADVTGGAAILNVVASGTTPVFITQGDNDTGIGQTGADQLSLIAGGVQVANLTEAAGVVQFIVPLQNDAANPSIAFGDGDSGFFQPVDNLISVTLAGTERFQWAGVQYLANNANGPSMLNEGATASNPTYAPNKTDLDTGIGWRAADIGVLIAGAQNCMEFGEAGAAPLVAFYGTAAIALQTGVAVSSAGIHAALVNLGLITA